jgi:hypothetical protein
MTQWSIDQTGILIAQSSIVIAHLSLKSITLNRRSAFFLVHAGLSLAQFGAKSTDRRLAGRGLFRQLRQIGSFA